MLTKVIEQAKIDHFTKWFERADKIVIVSHVSPDGDAIGSSLGLYHFLDSQEKTVNVIVPNAFPDFLRWMPGSKDILLYDRYKDFADKLIAEADVILSLIHIFQCNEWWRWLWWYLCAFALFGMYRRVCLFSF